MMGQRKSDQGQFFYEFNLDDVVPPDHLVRKIDAMLDLGWVHKELAPYYSHTGRPSIDPELMIRMLIVGYVFAIRSERMICREVQVNLAYRWYCRLGIEDQVPDHSAFSRARHERFRESDVLRRVFERVVTICIVAGLVGGEAFSIDASLIKADVDKHKRVPGDQPADWPTPEQASRAVREYLAALDAAGREDEGDGGHGGGSSNGGGGKPPKEVSLTDPQAAWTARKGMDPFFAYDANYLIDNKLGIIVDAEGTRANRTDEIAVTETMIVRIERRFGLAPQRLAGDTAYGAARLLKWLWDRGIAPHMPGLGQVQADRGSLHERGLRLQSRQERLHLSRRRRAHAFRDHRPGAHSPLPGEQERLFHLRTQGPMHYSPGPQGLAGYRRGRTRSGSRARQYRCLPGLSPRTQESRDEVRAHEAHPQARPAALARSIGCEGRGAAHRDSAEPEAARKAPLPSPAPGHRRMCSVGVQ